jgi:LDH2 family malate/lactate/ureidoglycolate dehydrogenase
MNETIRYRADDLNYFCRSVLENLDVPAEHAKQVSQCLVQADLRGVDSHGVIRLPVYAGRIRKGLVNPRPKLEFLHEHAAAALLDGDNGLGAVVGATAMQRAIELAAKTGIGLVSARHSNHFGVASFYVEKAIAQGFIGCAASNAPPHMAPFGGRERFLGTNPFAVGIPAGSEPPLVFDASTSVVARGKIIVAAQEGKPIPLGWAIDKAGNPTTDAAAGLAGSVLPFGGPKGSAISFILDIICGLLSGAAYAHHLKTLENLNVLQDLGHVFVALRTDLFMSAQEFGRRMDEILHMLKSSAPAAGNERVLASGEIERQNEARNRARGVPLVPSIVAQLTNLATELGLTFPAPMKETVEMRQ